MDVGAARIAEQRGQARCCEAFSGHLGRRGWKPAGHTMVGTLPEPNDRRPVSARAGGKFRIERRKIAFTSSRAAVCGQPDRPLSKKIIGRSISIFRERFSRGSGFRRWLRAVALFHQPARQHGGGIFLHPKVEKRADLLAQIGGMAETREFITLQRVSRSGEKELPRGLGLVVVHVRLRKPCVN